MELIAVVFRIGVSNPEEDLNESMLRDWRTFVFHIYHGLDCECKNKEDCEFYYPPRTVGYIAFFNCVRVSFGRVAIPTRVFLEGYRDKGISEEGLKYCDTWRNFQLILELPDKDIRLQHRLDRKCCYPLCPTRLSFEKPTKKNVCAHCHAAYYCGRTCQKRRVHAYLEFVLS